jgi:hypothetical protein
MICVLASVMLAAEARLGPERAVTSVGAPFNLLGGNGLSVARSGDHEIAVWGDEYYRIFGSFDGVLIWITQPPGGTWRMASSGCHWK